jgi:hypothetical protein
MHSHNGGLFMVSKPIDGKPATHANGGTVGFWMSDKQADAWHKAGIAHGGTTIEKGFSQACPSRIPSGVRGEALIGICVAADVQTTGPHTEPAQSPTVSTSPKSKGCCSAATGDSPYLRPPPH